MRDVVCVSGSGGCEGTFTNVPTVTKRWKLSKQKNCRQGEKMKFTKWMAVVEMCLGGAAWLTYYLVTGDKSFGGVLISIMFGLPLAYGAFYLMNWKYEPKDIGIE